MLLRGISSFCHLKQCHIPQGLNQQFQNVPFAPFSPLTTKNFDRCMLTLALILNLFICLGTICHVTSTNANCNCHCSTAVTSKLTINREGPDSGTFVSNSQFYYRLQHFINCCGIIIIYGVPNKQ
jgi:hypothetical protein